MEKFTDGIPEKSRVPDNYKKNIYMGYFSIILLLISAFLTIVANSIYGSSAGLLARFILILGIIIFVYFIFQIIKIKDEIMNDPSYSYHKMFILLVLAGLLIIAHSITSL